MRVLGPLRCRFVEQDGQQRRHHEEHPHATDYAYVPQLHVAGHDPAQAGEREHPAGEMEKCTLQVSPASRVMKTTEARLSVLASVCAQARAATMSAPIAGVIKMSISSGVIRPYAMS